MRYPYDTRPDNSFKDKKLLKEKEQSIGNILSVCFVDFFRFKKQSPLIIIQLHLGIYGWMTKFNLEQSNGVDNNVIIYSWFLDLPFSNLV